MTHIHPEAIEYAAHEAELARAAGDARPMFSREWLAKIEDYGDPDGCAHCGAVAGACSSYPNCPGARP